MPKTADRKMLPRMAADLPPAILFPLGWLQQGRDGLTYQVVPHGAGKQWTLWDMILVVPGLAIIHPYIPPSPPPPPPPPPFWEVGGSGFRSGSNNVVLRNRTQKILNSF